MRVSTAMPWAPPHHAAAGCAPSAGSREQQRAARAPTMPPSHAAHRAARQPSGRRARRAHTIASNRPEGAPPAAFSARSSRFHRAEPLGRTRHSRRCVGRSAASPPIVRTRELTAPIRARFRPNASARLLPPTLSSHSQCEEHKLATARDEPSRARRLLSVPQSGGATARLDERRHSCSHACAVVRAALLSAG
jgi:hypothetical protein